MWDLHIGAVEPGFGVGRVDGDDGDLGASGGQGVELALALLRLTRRARDAQQFGQEADEDALDPGRHLVRRRTAEVDVEDDDGDQDGQRHQDHGEEQVLAQERDRQRRGRNDLGQQQEEDGQRQQDGHTQRHLLAGIGRQVEDQHRQARDAHARDDQVHRVEERLPSQCYVEEDVQVRRIAAAAVVLDVAFGRHVHDVPLHAQVELAQINAHFDEVRIGDLSQMFQVHLHHHQI